MKKNLGIVLFGLILLICFSFPAYAEKTLTIAAGAGYKKMVNEMSAAFTKATGIKVQQLYGNMGQVTAQAQNSGVVDIVIGDKKFLDKTKLVWGPEFAIGQGKVVMAVAKGVKLDGLDTLKLFDAAAAKSILTNDAITRIAFPDKKKAIYGRATFEMLTKLDLYKTLEPKLLMVGTVPQVSAYVLSSEVDLGFINLTDGLAIKDKIANVVPVDTSLYSPIIIVAHTLKDCPNPDLSESFGKFLETPEARKLAEKHGL